MDADHATVTRDVDGPVTILTIDNPRRRNALSSSVQAGLLAGMEAALADPGCRAVVLTGAGGHFCSGADLSVAEPLSAVGGRRSMAYIHRLVRLIVTGEKPIIAAVEGHAAGAGMPLAAACDIVVAAEGATFTPTFSRVGVVPDLGATWVLPLRMGLGRARLVMMTGRALDAATAERWGLAETVVPTGEARARAVELGRELAARSPLSLGFTKALLARMPADLDGMLRAEADAQALLFVSADLAEGRDAFMEKRQPRFPSPEPAPGRRHP